MPLLEAASGGLGGHAPGNKSSSKSRIVSALLVFAVVAGTIALAIAAAQALAHGDLPKNCINLALGVRGSPDCTRIHLADHLLKDDAAMDLVCSQRMAPEQAIKIACIGDSITAGVCSSGGDHSYPSQLQILLDDRYGQGVYSVTNLGVSGATMRKEADSPFWNRPQYRALVAAKWDIVTIMLGTNDAKDSGDHGPSNWLHDCGDVKHQSVTNCSFARDYTEMIDLVKTLGTTPGGPKIYLMIPPPLMKESAIGANQTVINSVFPKLLPLIANANRKKVAGTIDVFTGMGGVSNWESAFPPECDRNSSWTACEYWCDAQACDQCHPNDVGYRHLASVVEAGLQLLDGQAPVAF